MSLSLGPSSDDDAKVKGGSGSSHGEESQPQRVLIEEITEQAEKLSVDGDAASATSSAAASSSAATAASASSSSSSSSSSSLREPFVLLAGAWFAKDGNAAVKRYYNKWNIQPTCHMHRWRYTQSEHTSAVAAEVIAKAQGESVELSDPSVLHSLLVNLCNSSSFRSVFRVFQSSSRSMELLPPVATTTVSKVNFRPVPTRCTDLHLFDKLWTEAQPPIVYGDVEDPLPDLTDKAASGQGGAGAAAAATAAALAAADDRADDGSGSGGIRKCFEDVVDGGIPVADELRKVLLDRDSEQFELFSPAERSELLFVLLTHLCVGGGLCQYENSVGPYLSVLRLLYRDLVSVRTNRNTDALEVASIVLRVSNFVVTDTQGAMATERILPLFGDKDKDKHHLCLFSIDPQRQHITSYYFAHTSAW